MLKTLIPLICLVCAIALANASPALAGGVITNCLDDTDFSAKLVGGGSVSFNCGIATITLNSTKTISADTTIDGGGKITLTGISARRLFIVDPGKTFTLKNIVLERGYSGTDDSGGAAVNSSGHLILVNATIQNSYSPAVGGAIAATGSIDITNSKLLHNKASNGGAIYANGHGGGEVKITGATFDDNSASSSVSTRGLGGAISAQDDSTIKIDSSTFTNNRAISGGAIHVSADTSLDLRGGSLSGNQANQKGGGIFVSGANIMLGQVTLSRNTAPNGGGIYAFASTASVYGSTLNDNGATAKGGGFYNDVGLTTLTNVTLSHNQAGEKGGGLYNYAAESNLVNVTLKDNSSTSGGGVLDELGSTLLTNTLIGHGASGANCVGTGGGQFNLSDDNTCSFGESRDNVPLFLGPLANNGGPTKTHLPQVLSPALDFGTFVVTMLTDQRGVTRPQGSKFDVGSVEVVCGKPVKPQLVKPGNNKKPKGPAVKLNWEDARCAVTYNVLVKLGSPSGRKIFKKNNLSESQTTTDPLTKGETYVWRVTAKHQIGGAKSEWFTFKVK